MKHRALHEKVAGVTQDSGAASLSPCPLYPYLQDLLPYSRIILKERSYHLPDGLVISSTHGLVLHRCYYSLLYFEQRMVSSHGGQDRIEVFAVGVGDKDLSKSFATHQFDNLFHPKRI